MLTANQETYDQIVSNIRADQSNYGFFIDFLHNVRAMTDANVKQKEINVLYVLIQCLYKIDLHSLKIIQSGGLRTDIKDFYEADFFNEIINLLNTYRIDPAYKYCHRYLTFREDETMGMSFLNSQVWTNFVATEKDINEKLMTLIFLWENDELEYLISCFSVSAEDYRTLRQEFFDPSIFYQSEISKYPLDFKDLRKSTLFLRAYPELTHTLINKAFDVGQRYQKIIGVFDIAIATLTERENERARQKKAEAKEKAEKDAAKKAEMARKRKEKERKFKEEQALRQREYEERVQARAAAEAVRRAAEQAARQQEQLAMRKAATSDIDVSSERAAPKVKTRGVAYTATPGDADENQTHIELAQHVVRVIPEDIREFVTEVMEADFDTVRNSFERQMAATVTLTKGNKWVFSFRSPVNNELLRFYADNPYGAQSEKFRTAWRALMQDALERGEMKLR